MAVVFSLVALSIVNRYDLGVSVAGVAVFVSLIASGACDLPLDGSRMRPPVPSPERIHES